LSQSPLTLLWWSETFDNRDIFSVYSSTCTVYIHFVCTSWFIDRRRQLLTTLHKGIRHQQVSVYSNQFLFHLWLQPSISLTSYLFLPWGMCLQIRHQEKRQRISVSLISCNILTCIKYKQYRHKHVWSL
jgi:hypothetical protein